MTATRPTVWRAFVRSGVWGVGVAAMNNSYSCAMSSAACKWSPKITHYDVGSRYMYCVDSDTHNSDMAKGRLAGNFTQTA